MRLLVIGTVLVVMLVGAAGAAAQPPLPDPLVPDPCWTLPGEPPPPGCIPQPTPLDPDAPVAPTPPLENTDNGGDDDGPGGVTGWIVDGITNAINSFFRDLVTDALNPLLDLLGRTLLTTPTVESLPVVGQLWEDSRVFAVAAYVLLVMVAGLVLMAYETVQTRYSVKEIAPRIVVGFLAVNLSLLLAGQAITFANAATHAVLGEGVDPDEAADTLTTLVMGALDSGGIFVIFVGLALAAALVALLITYVVRVALTVILIAGAPLALACHGLPQTEGVARWWWRAFFGVLAIQLGQSLALVAALRVFFAPGGFTIFGPTTDGLVNLIVTLALFYILIKIPFWVLQQVQFGGGRSFVGGLVKGYIAYKTFGLLRGHGRGHGPSGGHRPSHGGGAPHGGSGGRPGGRPGGSPPGSPPIASPGVPTRPSPPSPPPVSRTRATHPSHPTHRHRVVSRRLHVAHATDTNPPDESRQVPGGHPRPVDARPLHPHTSRRPRPGTAHADHAPGTLVGARHRPPTPAETARVGWPHPANRPTPGHGGQSSPHPTTAPEAQGTRRPHADLAPPARSRSAAPRPRHVLWPHAPVDGVRASRPGGGTS